MKRYSFILILIGFNFFIFGCTSLVKFRYGIENLSYLKGVKDVNVVFDYSNVSVGKYEDERDYVLEKVREKNEKKPGEGDEREEKWYAQRERFFEPTFLEELNRFTVDKTGINFSKKNVNAEYTVVIFILFMEPGYNVGIASRDAEIDAEIAFYERGNFDEPLSEFDAYEIKGSNTQNASYFGPGTYAAGPGDINSYSVSGRLSDAYRKCGVELAKYINKNIGN